MRIGLTFNQDERGMIAVLGRQHEAYSSVIVVQGADFSFQTRALFVENLSIGGLLGRRGFFDNFRVTFDHSTEPPSIYYEAIQRG